MIQTRFMTGPEQARRVTRVFPAFLGLRLVPVGLFFLSIGVASPFPGETPTWVQAILFLAAAAAIWPIHGWYRREFGAVEPERLRLGRNWMILAGLVVAVLAMSAGAHRLGGISIQVLLVVVTFFLTAVLFALPRAFAGSSAELTLLAAMVVLGVAILLFAGRDPVSFNYLGALFSGAVGMMLCTAGVIEHRRLIRTLGRPGTAGDV